MKNTTFKGLGKEQAEMESSLHSVLNEKKHNEAPDILAIIKSEIRRVEQNLERVDAYYKRNLRFMDRLSDRIAEIGGSWAFISSFLFFLIVWMFLNSYILLGKPFDPYPYILLNLILSTIAALQAPIILMSQNRSAKRDQARLEIDLEKDLRDLHVDQESHRILLELRKEIWLIKEKLKRKNK